MSSFEVLICSFEQGTYSLADTTSTFKVHILGTYYSLAQALRNANNSAEIQVQRRFRHAQPFLASFRDVKESVALFSVSCTVGTARSC